MKNTVVAKFLVCKGLLNDDVGGARVATYFRRYGRELVSKPAISLKKCWGPTLERLLVRPWVLVTGGQGYGVGVYVTFGAVVTGARGHSRE